MPDLVEATNFGSGAGSFRLAEAVATDDFGELTEDFLDGSALATLDFLGSLLLLLATLVDFFSGVLELLLATSDVFFLVDVLLDGLVLLAVVTSLRTGLAAGTSSCTRARGTVGGR